MPGRIRKVIGIRAAPQKCRAKNNSQILTAHAIGRRILHYAVQMKGKCLECGIVRIWQVVDGGVEFVAAGDIIFFLCNMELDIKQTVS